MENILEKLVNFEKVQNFLELVLDEKVNLESLREIRKSQLLLDSQLYQSFFHLHVDSIFGEKRHSQKLISSISELEIYNKGELIALGFLTGGDKKNKVISLEGMNSIINQYSRDDNGSKLYKIIISKLKESELLDSFTVQGNLAPMLNDLYITNNQYFRTGYAGVLGLAIESLDRNNLEKLQP